MKTVSYGKVNDCVVYAMLANGRLYPMTEADLEHEAPDYKIYYDSGVYPSITNVPEYICNQITINQTLLTVPEVADRLKVKATTVREWIKSGKLPAIDLGSRTAGYRVRESDLEAFLSEREK